MAVSGGRGFIGKHLISDFENKGWKIIRLNRNDLYGSIEMLAERIKDSTIIIHLAGAPIFQRWTETRKKIFYKSRVETTQNIVKAIELNNENGKLQHLINASAIGIYKSDLQHDETSPNLREDFLGHLIADWEKSALGAEIFGVKVTCLRLGMVLGNDGGAFDKMLKLYRWGLGANLGSGKQNVPWIAIDDVVGAINFIAEKTITGAVNIVAPKQLNYKKFHRKMALLTSRLSFLRIPSFMVRLAMGKVAHEVLETPIIHPKVLLENGFEFRYADIDDFLRNSN